MHSRPRALPFWITSLSLLLLYGWTLTESAAVTLRVGEGQCSAELYGRASEIPCPDLSDGQVITYVERADESSIALTNPLDALVPHPVWIGMELVAPDGHPLSQSAPLPDTFELHARLRRPTDPAGIVLLRPGMDSGWVFILDGQARHGEWREWADGEPAASLEGIPFDKPFFAQAKTLLRQLLNGWVGALLVVIFAWLLSRVAVLRGVTTRISSSFPLIPSPFIVAVLTFIAFALALRVSVNVLERVPHVQDSVTYLFQAQTLARGELTAPAPPLAASTESPHFAQEFLLVRDGRWFGKYPPGYPVILAAGVVAGAHWLINPLLAALTVPLMYVLARILYRRDHRLPTTDDLPAFPLSTDPLTTDHWLLLPPLLLAISPFFLVMSGSLMAHTAELFWTTLFMFAWVKALERRRWRWAAVAGVAIGALFLTRQFTALTIGISFGLGWLAIVLFRQRTGNTTDHDLSQTATSPLLPSVALLLLFVSPFLLAFFAYQATVTGDPLTDPRLLYWPYDRVGFGPGIGEAESVFTFASTEVGPALQWADDPTQPPRGHSPSRGLYNLARNFNELENDLFGWPALFTLAFVWLAFLLRHPAAADWVLLLVILAVAGGYVGYWASGIAYGPRYFYAALPALVILTARGVTALGSAFGARPTALLLSLLIAINLINLPGLIETYRGYNFVSAAPRSAVEAAVERPALVFVTASEFDWWEYGEFFSGNTPLLDGEIVYARDLGAAENERLRENFPGRVAYLWRDGQLSPIAP